MGRERLFSDDDIRRCISAGMTLRVTAQELGCSYKTVQAHVQRLGLHAKYDMSVRHAQPKHIQWVASVEARRRRTAARKSAASIILRMRSESHTYQEIAEATGKTIDYIAHFCQMRNCAYTAHEVQKATGQYRDDVIVAENVRNLNRGVSYVSGYVTKESKIMLRHDECGHTFEMTYHSLWKSSGRVVKCPVCAEEKRQLEQKQKMERLATTRECAVCGTEFHPQNAKNRFCSDDCSYKWHLREQFLENQRRFVPQTKVCKFCGKEFESQFRWRSAYCSKRCQKRGIKGSTVYTRIKSKSQLVDTDITLPKLYERDGGICYICGSATNWDDKHINPDGYWVYGDTYPSIDHVIPLAKMGTHSWGNVKLACRRCNSIKSDSV